MVPAVVRTMAPVNERDWYTWHYDYDDPGTALARRLAAVQEQIRPHQPYPPHTATGATIVAH